MRSVFTAFLMLFLLAVGQPVAAQGQYGTPEEAVTMVDRAIAYYTEIGREKAFAAFSDKQGKFIDRDLYVIVADAQGVFLAHGVNPGLVNRNLWDLKDVNGVFIVRDMIKSGQANPGGGWVEYVWTNPVSKKLDPKRTYVKQHDGLFFMVGVYDLTKM